MIQVIEPRSGVAFELKSGERLKVIDPQGEQVADLVAFNRADTRDALSSGRSIDYASKLFLGLGDHLYSNRSTVLLDIVEDTVGRHDFLLSPCSAEMFRIIYHDEHPHRGCFGNLAEALQPFGIASDAIPTAFNVFMNVQVDGQSGVISVEPPLSRAGDFIIFEAQTDLVIGLTACSAGQSNNFSYKPIHYEVIRGE
ncbi:MAG TPA: urea carboxylase-associated family protein [Rhodanobacter sp.]|nr:urea carboxylase-associated family protein [Rhodanobacter sp.]